MDEILMLQEEISELQSSLAEELVTECPESDPAEQLALQSTLTVLAERMSTIKMKASGKQQLLEVTADFGAAPNSSCCIGSFWVTYSTFIFTAALALAGDAGAEPVSGCGCGLSLCSDT